MGRRDSESASGINEGNSLKSDFHEVAMPLRDHFHPPLSKRKNWEGFHGQWPAMIVQTLNRKLPPRFEAEPNVHVGSEIEVDAATLESHDPSYPSGDSDGGLAFDFGGPSLAVETELLTVSEYEVRILDAERDRRLVATIEIVSPSNKDRPQSRQVFAAKCEALLKKGVSVAVVDLVTAKDFNLYADLLELVGQHDPTLGAEPPATYAAACRWLPRGRKHVLETWSHVLRVGQKLPTLPVWLAENLAVPLDLEESYEETCRALRIG